MRAPPGSQIANEVRALDHIEIVLDYKHGVADGNQTLKHVQQIYARRRKETRCRLVKDVDRSTGGAFGEFLRQFDALCLATRERRRRLAQLDVTKADIEQCLKLHFDLRNVLEYRQRLFNRRIQQVSDPTFPLYVTERGSRL